MLSENSELAITQDRHNKRMIVELAGPAVGAPAAEEDVYNSQAYKDLKRKHQL